MKYIITESKMFDIFSKYIEKVHPELLSLTHNRKETDYGYYINYYNELGNYYSILSYLYEEEDGNNLHLLIVKSEFPSEIENIFGRKYLSLLKKWFESVYELPVDTIEERI